MKTPQNTSFHVCPCGSQVNYDQCCGSYISGRKFPETPEALMRSRYTAYTQSNIPYIEATMRGKASENFNTPTIEKRSQYVKWKHLKVKNAFNNEDHGYVEFVAHGIFQGMAHKLHEISEFKKIDGKWYYVDAVVGKKFDELSV